MDEQISYQAILSNAFDATRSGRLIRAEFGVTQADSIVTTRELGL